MGSLGVTSVGSDTLTLALHALASARFGIAHQFRSESDDASKSNINVPNYRDRLDTAPRNVKPRYRRQGFLTNRLTPPKSLPTLGKSAHNLKRHMVEMVNTEKLGSVGIYPGGKSP